MTQSFMEALDSLSANKLRSGLTILGIVIGVAAVIAMLAVGNGAQSSILGQINDIGSNLLFVMSGNEEVEIRNPRPLTLADAKALADPLQAPSVSAVVPVISGRANVSFAGEQTTASISGSTPDMQTARSYTLSEGEFFTDDNVNGYASVAVIGVDVADQLFGRRDNLVGEKIRVNGQPVRIIGVLESKGGSSFGSQDNNIIVPITTARTRLLRRADDSLDQLLVQAVSPEQVEAAQQEIGDVLRARHRTPIGEEDFSVFSQTDIVAVASSITSILTIFLGGIAGISLLVGGIGIMNIMLVSVTERTREIGLRKALGARKRDILLQFLTESALLSMLGGVIGILFGWLIGVVVAQIAAASGTPLPVAVTADSVLLAVVFSTAVGLFFGIYPANRAASLQPVEALRYE